jgi:hypothetical protein
VASSAADGQSYPPLVAIDGEGNDYMTEAVAEANSDTGGGLPNDGFFAADSDHPDVQLAFSDSSSAPNSFILNAPDTSILSVGFPVVLTSYSTVQIYGTSTEGSSSLTVTLAYTDSSTDVTSFTVPDWFQYSSAVAPVFVVQSGLSRFSAGTPDDDSDTPALYGATAQANPAKTLVSVTISVAGGSNNRFVLYGATAY